MPNYRIVAIHGPNRITVRDEKGNESVTRASHLKVCDWKEKVTSMVPDQREYDKSGRSTKLLIHPKDIPDLELLEISRNNSEISLDTEISIIEENNTSERGEEGEISPNQQVPEALVIGSGLAKNEGEFLPKAREQTNERIINTSKQCIAGISEEGIKQGTMDSSRPVNDVINRKWLYNPVNCVSNWSKALRQGVANFVGLDMMHTARIAAMENGKPEFSFFL